MAGKRRVQKIEGKRLEVIIPEKLYGFLKEKADSEECSIPEMVRLMIKSNLHEGTFLKSDLKKFPDEYLWEELAQRMDSLREIEQKYIRKDSGIKPNIK